MRLIYLALIVFAVGCQSTTKNLGEQFTTKSPVSVDEVIRQLNTSGEVTDVQVEGTVEKSCMTEGCWFTIKNASGDAVLFNVKDKKFRVPINSPGKRAILLADAAKDITAEQGFLLEVRGMRFD